MTTTDQAAVPHQPAARATAQGGSALRLPQAWNPRDHPSYIDLGSEGLRATYIGQGKSDAEAAACRTSVPIPAAAGIFYWENRIVSKGRDGYIGIGVCTHSVSLSRLPGWERGSYGYHGDDGNSFRGSGTGTAYGPTFTTGDVIGCCVNFLTSTIFYTKNGVSLGVAFSDVKGLLYPTVGLRTPQECVEANFGQRPFRFDIDSYVREEKERLRGSVEATPLPGGEAAPLLPRLVLSYLLHAGYAEAAASFGRAASLLGEAALASELELVTTRRRICGRVLAGDMDGALAETEERFPGLLARCPALERAIKRQKFVELFRIAPLAETMAYGQAELAPHFSAGGEEEREALCEVFSLLAYIEPASSPVAYLLAPSRREPVAAALEAALLEEQGRPAAHALEAAGQQATVCLQELVAENVPGAALLGLREALGLDEGGGEEEDVAMEEGEAAGEAAGSEGSEAGCSVRSGGLLAARAESSSGSSAASGFGSGESGSESSNASSRRPPGAPRALRPAAHGPSASLA